MSPELLGIWIFLGVLIITFATTVLGSRSADAKWQQRGRIAAIALVVEFVLAVVGLYLISSSGDSRWVF